MKEDGRAHVALPISDSPHGKLKQHLHCNGDRADDDLARREAR